MELILAHKTETEIDVTCDGHYSHSFDLQTLPPNNEKELSHLIDDPVAYGKALYLALFPPGTAAGITILVQQWIYIHTCYRPCKKG